MANQTRSDRLALALFVGTVLSLVFAYGIAVGRFEWFPFSLLERLHGDVRYALGGDSDTWFIRSIADRDAAPVSPSGETYEGLNLVTRFENETEFRAEIVDMDGRTVHTWEIDWFELWPDAEHIPERRTPKSRPGTHIHGAVVMPDGDLVFNFEHLGLMRLDGNGAVVWRLPYSTHHSVVLSDSGNLWVCGRVDHEEADERFPHRSPPFTEHTALEVSPDGEILAEWSIARILEENGLHGLLYLGTTANEDMRIGTADLLHLNDVEPFPATMEEGLFRRGDILVSLRNINTVLVFNRDSRRIRYISTGEFVRQHDPDFLDGNRFSVYDNNNVGPESNGQQSRIVVVDAANGSSDVHFEGSSDIPFYSSIMGKHQWLPNGNLLLTESMQGRAIEIDQRGNVVWEYVNEIRPGTVGLVEEVQRIPIDHATVFGAEREASR